MKSKNKFLWVYTVILFSVALILILFAGMTTQNYERELESHETAKVGLQKSVTELSQVNTNLKQENDELKKENDELKKQNEELAAAAAENEINKKLMEALVEFDKGNRRTAKNMLAELDAEKLTEQQTSVYNKIMK